MSARAAWRRVRRAAAWLAVGLVLAAAGSATGACAALLGTRPLGDARPGGTSMHAVRVDGRDRTYLLHLPPAAAHGRVPLVLAFHGDGGNASVLRAATRLDDAADALGFAVAYPNGSGTLRWLALSWNVGTCCGWAQAHHVDELAFADALVAALGRLPTIDAGHVYAAGFSAGGMLALRLACERSGRIAAVADVAGAMPDLPCRPQRPVSVLLIQGTDDDELRDDLRELRQPEGRGHRFAHSLEAVLRFWARRAGCTRGAVARDSSPGLDRQRADGCAAGQVVELYTVADHPHAWPGGLPSWPLAPRPAPQLDASRLALAFFRRVGSRADSARVGQ